VGRCATIAVDSPVGGASTIPRLRRRGVVLEMTDRLLVEIPLTAEGAGSKQGCMRFGCQLGSDDFGAGYSSIASLRSWPFDRAKDRSHFVAALDQVGEMPGVVIQADCRARAGALGLAVLIEGVETGESRGLLRACWLAMRCRAFCSPRPGGARGQEIEPVGWATPSNGAPSSGGRKQHRPRAATPDPPKQSLESGGLH